MWDLRGLPVEKLQSHQDIPSWARCAKKQGGEVGNWRPDGPKVKVEFLRQSGGNRLTLVLHKDAEPVCSFWARMTVSTPAAAVKKLGVREGIPRSKVRGRIGCWSNGEKDPRTKLSRISTIFVATSASRPSNTYGAHLDESTHPTAAASNVVSSGHLVNRNPLTEPMRGVRGVG